MSVRVCGKRLELEDIFGSPSSAPLAKRSRCSPYGSPIRSSDFGFDTEDKLSFLLRMFPSIDRKVVELVLNSHNHKTDDAIKNLRNLCLGDDSTTRAASLTSVISSNENATEGGMSAPESEQNAEGIQDDSLHLKSKLLQNGSSWADLLVQEMTNASGWDDVRGRTTNFLEEFERGVLGHYTASQEQQEIASMKEQLQCLLRDNQVLKRAVAIQYERNFENEEKLKEVQELKHIISQYQEEVRTLELKNYSLNIHLQRAQESSSIPSHFHPDIF